MKNTWENTFLVMISHKKWKLKKRGRDFFMWKECNAMYFMVQNRKDDISSYDMNAVYKMWKSFAFFFIPSKTFLFSENILKTSNVGLHCYWELLCAHL